MTVEGFVDVIQILIAAAVLIWFFSGPWPSFWVDMSRQRCFELRDRLFLLAVDGGIGFDDPLYRRTREWLNACITHAHDMKLWNVMAFILACRPDTGRCPGLLADILGMPDGPAKTELREIVEQGLRIQVELMLARSPFLLAVTILAPLFVLVGLATDRLRNLHRRVASLSERLILSYDAPRRPQPETGTAAASA